ncbi:phosphopantetheine-binding protein [Streptomyces cyaneochromogenes]|uniref:phosphopantetheine-binding protein n=1 Tax=Streptomyces cyaneochromogenes TaxID=2496836 RepID=UPI00158C13E0|nr:phosphopantetheine-binding protein [Streptomyces cyaneochromogenes]
MNRLDAAQEITTESVRLLLADILGTEIFDDLTFLSQGGDSYHAVLVVERVEELWGIEADFTAVLRSTPGELAEALGAATRPS